MYCHFSPPPPFRLWALNTCVTWWLDYYHGAVGRFGGIEFICFWAGFLAQLPKLLHVPLLYLHDFISILCRVIIVQATIFFSESMCTVHEISIYILQSNRNCQCLRKLWWSLICLLRLWIDLRQKEHFFAFFLWVRHELMNQKKGHGNESCRCHMLAEAGNHTFSSLFFPLSFLFQTTLTVCLVVTNKLLF